MAQSSGNQIVIAIFLFGIILSVQAGNKESKTVKRGTTGLELASGPWNNFFANSQFVAPPPPATGLGPWSGLNGINNGFGVPPQFDLHSKAIPIAVPLIPGLTIQKHIGIITPVSPVEVEAAVTAAKDASANVLSAQHRVLAAKEAVLAQQKIASAREAAAQAAQQRTEAAAQAQRAEANAAATAVVLAQQRLADAKAQVAAHQRIAAAKEAHAAAVIQKSANAAAHEIQRSQNEAAKLAALQRSESAAIQHVSATKDANLAATTAAVAAHYAPTIPQAPWTVPFNPWG